MTGGISGGGVGAWPHNGRSEVGDAGVVTISGSSGTSPENLGAKLSA